MKKNTLFGGIYRAYFFISIFSLLIIGWYSTNLLRSLHYREVQIGLEARARLLKPYTLKLFSENTPNQSYDELCKKLGKVTETRITIILPSGEVVGDSEREVKSMDNHADRPEVIACIRKGSGFSIRYSHTLNYKMFYVAIPVIYKGNIIYVIRASMEFGYLDARLRVVYYKIVVLWLSIAFISALLYFINLRKVTKSLKEMKVGTKELLKGNLSYKIPISKIIEIDSVSEDINLLASQLNSRISKLRQGNNEKEGLLSSMAEGVLAVNYKEEIIFLNKSVTELFDCAYLDLSGRNIQTIRNTDLNKFVKKILYQKERIEDEITLNGTVEKYVQLRGSTLRDSNGLKIGALVVFNDITRLRKLEALRREFVSNVSHELRTPITSIKGFVETLLDGAINEPKEAERFLNIIKRQSDRLIGIIEDLLSLSRIEKYREQDEVLLKTCEIKTLLEACVSDCERKIKKQKIKLTLECGDIKADINFALLEQAIVNLIENAINYSDFGGSVSIKAKESDTEVIISVSDKGCGIQSEHLPRLFERFYRVDPSRNRKAGGTGLGLAIVKHIVQAHKGRVSVDSVFGEGSTFCIILPRFSI